MSRPATAAERPGPYFTDDHRDCDAAWAEVEAASDGEAARFRAAFEGFERATRRHFDLEEHLLFPAIEAAAPFAAGPTSVMRAEHAQMRGLLGRMAQAAAAGRVDEVLDHGDTLLMLVGQHNLKEEGILYPLCDAHLSVDWPALAARIDAG